MKPTWRATEEALYQTLNLWDLRLRDLNPLPCDPPRIEPGSPEHTAFTHAFFLRERHSCQPSGVCATMEEQAEALEETNPALAAAYRQFVDEVIAWATPSDEEE